MSAEIRRVREDELSQYFDTMSTGFLARPEIERLAEEVRPLWDMNRVWGAFDAGHMRGTFRTWGTEVTVPGGSRIPATAVTNVAVMPTHRRRGLMRGMTAAGHADSRERGEVAAMLYAAEYPIYGRFGYGVGCREARWSVDVASTTFACEANGRVELVRPAEDTRDLIIRVFEQWRLRQPGEIRRREERWDFDLGLREDAWDPRWKGFLALHRNATGDVDGYVRYHGEDKWEHGQPRSVLTIDELHALSDDAYAALWRFAAEIDWVATLKAERRTRRERLPWLLTNSRAAEITAVVDGTWIRLFDVVRALAARTYERDGRIVLDVIDPEAPAGRVRVELDAGADGATCRVTHKSADLTLDIAALSAAYLGGTPLRDAVAATGADEHRPDALRDADRLLRTLDEPWCSTFF